MLLIKFLKFKNKKGNLKNNDKNLVQKVHSSLACFEGGST